MAFDASIPARHLGPAPAGARTAPSSRPGLWTRLLDALIESRRHQAEREVARLIELRGGKITDDFELEVERRLLRHDGL